MAAKPLPSQEVLRQLLDYDPETGVLRWKERGSEWFHAGHHSAETQAKQWNAKYAGTEAFTALSSDGYRKGSILDAIYRAHRVIWKMMTDEEPDQIDHIDGDRQNNRWGNLRATDNAGNMKNAQLYATNTSGKVGVGWYKAKRKWRAQIVVGGKARHLGFHNTFEEAVAARKSAEREYGFHENHGRSL